MLRGMKLFSGLCGTPRRDSLALISSISSHCGKKLWKDAPLKKITLANYRQDRYYVRIVKATEDLLRERGFVAPVELFIWMELLSAESVKDWRRGRVPYLERVIRCNLGKASRILRILRMHAHDLDLQPRLTVYKRWTRGPRTLLRFSKTGERGLEDAYACHFLSPGILATRCRLKT